MYLSVGGKPGELKTRLFLGNKFRSRLFEGISKTMMSPIQTQVSPCDKAVIAIYWLVASLIVKIGSIIKDELANSLIRCWRNIIVTKICHQTQLQAYCCQYTGSNPWEVTLRCGKERLCRTGIPINPNNFNLAHCRQMTIGTEPSRIKIYIVCVFLQHSGRFSFALWNIYIC